MEYFVAVLDSSAQEVWSLELKLEALQPSHRIRSIKPSALTASEASQNGARFLVRHATLSADKPDMVDKRASLQTREISSGAWATFRHPD